MSDIIRKDPRKLRILRNRLHPLYEAMLASEGQAQEVRGPSGLLRKNPHAVGFIGPNGIKRIDRTGGASGANAFRQSAATTQALPLHCVASPAAWLVVVPDCPNGELSAHDRDVFGQARILADSQSKPTAVVALLFGTAFKAGLTGGDTSALGLAGADRVIHFDSEHYDGYQPEQELAAMVAVEQDYAPLHWLFPDTPLSGSDRLRRLAARLGERPATQVWQVSDGIAIGRGGSERSDISRSLPRMLGLLSECAMPVDDLQCEALLLDCPVAESSDTRITDAGAVAVDPAEISLAEAAFVLSAGNGVHDWAQFHRVAATLGATEGGSRVAVDNGHLPRHRQVGATGTWVTASVYVAVGISGAVQHLQGIGQCDKVVAINTDPACDMVKRADLSLIGDSREILAALLDCLEGGSTAPAEEVA